MKPDPIPRYIALRNSLTKEKAALEARLAKINRALAGIPAPKGASGLSVEFGQRVRRTRNPMSLKAAITKVTKKKALTKDEILEAVKKLGYKFATNDPIGSINTQLYTKGQFRNVGGKFSPAKARSSAACRS